MNLWSYLFRLTCDEATADDLLQKAFFRFLLVLATMTVTLALHTILAEE